MIILFAILYGSVHLLGFVYPRHLWGADQLYYYPNPVSMMFVLLVVFTTAIAANDRWSLRIERFGAGLPWNEKYSASLWFKALLVVLFVASAYLFRDRSHFLGDSDKWIKILEFALSGKVPMSEVHGHHSRLNIPGLEYINIQQPLDLFVHFQIYRIGHWLWEWGAAAAYEWTSCVAGGGYVLVLWKIATLLKKTRIDQITLFVFLVTLGSIQFFFGYGESYTLVTLVTAWYVWCSLRYLQGDCGLAYPTLVLLLAVALHLMAFSLAFSWIYLLWRDEGRLGNSIRNPRVYLPLSVIGVLFGIYFFFEFYRPLSIPLWTPREEGQYALLSVPHWGNLLNELLLISPFGLIAGIAFLFKKVTSTPGSRFLGWATLGTCSLTIVHYISMGGRDWDLMAFPGLFYSLWGAVHLSQSARASDYFRQMRWAVLPLMVLHTSLWIGINSEPERATWRLENLLYYTPNQSDHYKAFTRGYFYLTIRNDPRQALPHFIEAYEAASKMDPPDSSLQGRYLKYAGVTLTTIGDFEQAANVLIQATRFDDHDVDLYFYLSAVLKRLGRQEEADQAYRHAMSQAEKTGRKLPSPSRAAP